MKKLLFVALAALTLGCYNDDFERVDGDINALKALLAQSDINNAALVAALASQVEASIVDVEADIAALASSTSASTAEVEADLASARELIVAANAEIARLEALIGGQNSVDGALARAIAALQTSVGVLEDDVEDLEDDLDDLEDEVDDLDIDLNTITWTPTFSTQTAVFTQIGTSLSGTTSRVIAIGTTTATITIDSTEHLEGTTAASDINNDGDHADSIRRTRIDTTYTGTVSGTTTIVGSHVVSGTLSNWIVIDDN